MRSISRTVYLFRGLGREGTLPTGTATARHSYTNVHARSFGEDVYAYDTVTGTLFLPDPTLGATDFVIITRGSRPTRLIGTQGEALLTRSQILRRT